MKNRLLFVAVISDRFPYPEYVRSLVTNLISATPFMARNKIRFIYGDTIGLQRHSARNELVNRFMDSGDNPEDRILFLDTDMTFPDGFITKLYMRDLPVVGGFYVKRLDPTYPLVYKFSHYNEHKTPMYNPMINIHRGSLYKCDATGAGCLMIKRSTIAVLTRPLFHHKHPFEEMSEEMSFFYQLMKKGIPVHVDTSVCCGHGYTQFYGWELFDKSRDGGRWGNIVDKETEDAIRIEEHN